MEGMLPANVLLRGGPARQTLPARVPVSSPVAPAAPARLPRVIGRLPFGYRHGPNGGLAVDIPQALVVAEAFRAFLRTQSVDAVLQLLLSGRLPQSGTRTWSRASVRRMLTNGAYVGLHRQGHLPRAVGVPIWIPVPAIVPLSTFMTADRLLHASRAKSRRRRTRLRRRQQRTTP